MFDTLVTSLCRDLGLNAPAGGNDGAFYLQVSDLEIGLLEETANESVILQCTVGNLGAEQRPGLFMELCEANYYWGATNGATLSFNAASGDVVLLREWSLAGLDAARLAKLLEGFVVAAEFWRDRLAARAETAPAARSGTVPFNPLATHMRV